MVGRQAVDEQGAHAEIVQAPGGAAELVALGAAPVLAEDAAHAVATAPEAGPHRDPRGHQRLDGGQGELVADQGDRLQQDEVGRMVLEGARQQLDELAPGRAVDVAVDREGEGHLVLAARLRDGVAPDLDAQARDVHPVQRREVPGALGLHLGGEAPGVGRDDVAAVLDVAAVHVAHDVGVVHQRPRAPERLVAPALGVGQPPPELGRDPSVEDHAAFGLQQLLDAAVRRRPLATSGQARPVLQHAHVGHCRAVPGPRRLSGGRNAPVRRGGKQSGGPPQAAVTHPCAPVPGRHRHPSRATIWGPPQAAITHPCAPGARPPSAPLKALRTGAGTAMSPRPGFRRSSCAGCS